MTEAPRLRMRTSSPSKRNSFGKRTACDRPDQKTLAVSIIASSLVFLFEIYHSEAGFGPPNLRSCPSSDFSLTLNYLEMIQT
jgi:hypothetical protein